MRVLRAVVVLSAALAIAPVARAEWTPGGVRVTPPSTPYDYHYLFGGVADAAGGVTLVWTHYTIDTLTLGFVVRLEAQHLQRDGSLSPVWPADGAVLRTWNTINSDPLNVTPVDVCSDRAGGAYVMALEARFDGTMWSDVPRAFRVRWDGSVRPLGDEVSGLFEASMFEVAEDGDHGLLFAVRQGYPYGAGGPLMVQRFDSSGVAQWADLEVAPELQRAFSRGWAIRPDGTGGAFVAWSAARDAASDTSDHDLFLQHVRADGTLDPVWPATGRVVSDADGDQREPSLCPDGLGGVYVAWNDLRDAIPALCVAAFGPDGAPRPGTPAQGRLLGPSLTAHDPPVIASDGATGCYLLRMPGDESHRVEARLHHVGADGLPLVGWPPEGASVDARPASMDQGALAVDPLQGVYVALLHMAEDRSLDVSVGHWSAYEGGIADWSQPLSTTVGDPIVRAVPSQLGVIVAWSEASLNNSVHAQRAGFDGLVAVSVALVSAEASADGVRVRWSVTLDGASALAVERRTESGDWAVIARPLPDGDGRVKFTDAAVEPGARYAYRLTWSERGIAGASAPVWVSVPATASLALRVGPNPAERASEVRFTLPRAGAASVTVLDVSGRRVRMLARGSFAAGEHVRPWDLRDDAGHTVGAGLYLVRFESEAGVLVTKARVTR
jgi:hypothetical protein